ncbi:MAG: metallophosphoesterase [Verrucomicrobia bacterium]|nr:metallophosphoesterase [Verrucomicrobiota bacterium]
MNAKVSSDYISENGHDDALDRRGFLKCMAWAGTGVIWSINGGILTSSVLGQESKNGNAIASAELNFVQISDSHIGFDKPANTDVVGTFRETVARINALPKRAEFLLHTGDLTHLSDPAQFDTLAQLLKECRTGEVFYVPGEHDIYDGGGQYRDRFGKNTTGSGWYSFDQKGVHFVGLVNVANIQEGGLGTLGAEQLAWLEKDLKGLSASTPIVLFAHIPLWAVYPKWGWGTGDAERALSFVRRFGSVTVLNGHIHQVMQKVEGNITFHTARGTAFPLPTPGSVPKPVPVVVEAAHLKQMLGLTSVGYTETNHSLAVIDSTLG